MKAAIAILMVLLALPAQAQLFSRESWTGAALGGLAGGIIGHNNGRKTAEGAAIGAGAGLLLGALAGESRRQHHSYSSGYYQPTPAHGYHRPNYAVTGTVVGGIAGGVIGHNNGRHTGEGIAIGAGAGLLLGAVAEQQARRNEAALLTAQPAVTYVAEAPVTVEVAAPVVVQQPPAQPAPIVARLGASQPSMTRANALFGR